MHRKYLVGLFLVLLAASCAGNEEPAEGGAADPTSQPEANATMPAPDVANPAAPVPDGHTSRNSLDWAGTYSGVLPCADCPGIETVLTLNSDGTYERTSRYIDEAVAPQTASGIFTWGATGNTIALDTEGDVQEQYQVGENQLFRLDRNGNRITSELAAHYVLRKHVHDPAIEDKRWKLVELRGNPVDAGSDAVLTLRAADAVASGNASCNTFRGGYAIKTGQQISFARNMALTRKACPDMSTESAFLEVLGMVDNYSLSEDGMLSLNRARMAPLARFEVVEEGG